MIKDGKLKFGELNGLGGIEDPSRAKGKAVRQEQEAPKEENFEKATIPMDDVPISKIERNEAVCSSTTKG